MRCAGFGSPVLAGPRAWQERDTFSFGKPVVQYDGGRTSVIKQKVFIGRGRKLAVVVSCTIGRSSVALFLYSSRTHLPLYLGLDASCLPLLPGLRIHFYHENARTHTFERSIRSRLSQVVMGLSRERRCHGITSTLITDSHAITLPSLPLWVYARRRNSTGLTLARSTFGFDGSLDDGLVWL